MKENDIPAFPCGSGDMRDPQGMTLRDYFAAKAMQSMILTHRDRVHPLDDTTLSAMAYGLANEMLKAREE